MSRIINFIKRQLKRTLTIHVLGDSHVQVFEYMSRNRNVYPMRNVHIEFCKVQGATNLGLANPHSQTQSMPIYQEHLKKVGREDFVLFILGEVDCGFVIWYRVQKKNKTVEEQFELSLNNYEELMRLASRSTRKKIIVCSTPLPTITDTREKVVGEVANKRLEITASQRERTDLTLRYNKALKEICRKNGFLYLDYEGDVMNKTTNMVDSKFLNENPLDHHLSDKAFAGVLYPKLRELLGKKFFPYICF